jgi:hypothetical protein
MNKTHHPTDEQNSSCIKTKTFYPADEQNSSSIKIKNFHPSTRTKHFIQQLNRTHHPSK